jgi:hypothetical protein
VANPADVIRIVESLGADRIEVRWRDSGAAGEVVFNIGSVCMRIGSDEWGDSDSAIRSTIVTLMRHAALAPGARYYPVVFGHGDVSRQMMAYQAQRAWLQGVAGQAALKHWANYDWGSVHRALKRFDMIRGIDPAPVKLVDNFKPAKKVVVDLRGLILCAFVLDVIQIAILYKIFQ